MFKGLHRWLPSYLGQKDWSPPPGKTVDVMLCVVDHFEPLHHTDKKGALDRIALWNREFPRITTSFRDADGVGPRHTFFYPVEQYDPDLLKGIQDLCAASGGEVEIHLHHQNDTPQTLADSLKLGVENLRRHDFLAGDEKGNVRYGFIHGNWALDNSHPEGRHCGVNNELEVLQSTGCYADFTLPSAPDPAQTSTINQIYYAADTPLPKSHDKGERARVGGRPGGLLLVQGPLGLNW
ncbi:MAG TPA: hypothetical protein VK968_00075, partial [Roseimicrobium sp.]|nr:hypothetical protein [Roseimicrobium sp.]